MTKPSAIKAVLLAVFRPKAFIEYATLHDTAKAREAYGGRDLSAQEIEYSRGLAAERLGLLRHSLRSGWLLTLIAVVSGILVGVLMRYLLGVASQLAVLSLQLIGASTILAATLAVLGWEIQSMKGNTLPEKVNQWLFRFQYWVGTFLFVVSVAWSA